MLVRPGRVSPYRGSQRPLWPFTINRDSPQFAGPGYTLVSWWPMMPFIDGFDIAGNRNFNLTNNGPTSVADLLMGNTFDFVAGSTQFFEIESAVLADYPFTFTCWFNLDDVANNYALITLQDSSTTTFFNALQVRGDEAGNFVSAFTGTHGGAVDGQANTTLGVTAGQWHHAAGVFPSTSERSALIDGGNKGTNTETASAISGYNRTSVGRIGLSGPFAHMDGQLADARIYQGTVPDEVISQMFSPETRWDLYDTVRDIYLLAALPAVLTGGSGNSPIFRVKHSPWGYM